MVLIPPSPIITIDFKEEEEEEIYLYGGRPTTNRPMGHRDGATPIVDPTSIARGADSQLKASWGPTMIGVRSME